MKLNAYLFETFESYVLAKLIYQTCPAFIVQVFLSDNSLTIVCDSSKLNKFLLICKNHFNFKFLIDSSAVDMPSRSIRFNVIYLLRHFPLANNTVIDFKNQRDLQITLLVAASDVVPLLSNVHAYATLIWLEREIWDCFGIYVALHPDLRRILTDYGFQGFPFRKDFPLTGYVEVRYDTSLQRIVVEPLELTQEFRLFDFISPWVNSY
jgi:NADH:ubiquinone oxidoreductase subunit C